MKIAIGILALGALALPAAAQVIGGITPLVTTSPTISTLTTGTVLDVTAAVSADGRYVNMNVNPSFSSLEGFQTFNFGGTSSSGGTRAMGVAKIPFRPAQVGKVIFVDNDPKLLTASVPAMTLKAVSLKDAVKKVAGETKSNLVLGIRGFEQAGVNVTAMHDFSIEPGAEKDALLAMLKVAAPETDVVITSEDGVVHVVTQAQGDANVITRTYYVEDILGNLPRIVSNQTDLSTLKPKDDGTKADDKGMAALPPAVGGPGRANVKGKNVDAGSLQAVKAEKSGASTSISEIITSAVRPEIWKVNGGKIGEISQVNDRVTITAPASVHAILDGPKHYNPNAAPLYVNTSGL